MAMQPEVIGMTPIPEYCERSNFKDLLETT